MDVKLQFKVIYLVGQGEAANTEVRVTVRPDDGITKPATCRFLALNRDERENRLGTLVLTEALWRGWYGRYKNKDFMPGMDTAQHAAEKMVRTIDYVFYGCPLCNFRTKDWQAAQEHADQEATRILQFFDVAVEAEVK